MYLKIAFEAKKVKGTEEKKIDGLIFMLFSLQTKLNLGQFKY